MLVCYKMASYTKSQTVDFGKNIFLKANIFNIYLYIWITNWEQYFFAVFVD